jgi:hypothetical protein
MIFSALNFFSKTNNQHKYHGQTQEIIPPQTETGSRQKNSAEKETCEGGEGKACQKNFRSKEAEQENCSQKIRRKKNREGQKTNPETKSEKRTGKKIFHKETHRRQARRQARRKSGETGARKEDSCHREAPKGQN